MNSYGHLFDGLDAQLVEGLDAMYEGSDEDPSDAPTPLRPASARQTAAGDSAL